MHLCYLFDQISESHATEEGWLFLAVVIDLFTRKVVGWSMRPDMHRSLLIDALEMGLFQRRPPKGQRALV